MNKKYAILFALGLFSIFVGNVSATVNCNTIGNNGVITSDTNLTDDLNTTGNCLTIGASNVELDCQGHSLTGSNTGRGIYLNDYSRTLIKNCTLQNFASGIEFSTYASDNNAIGNTTQNNTNGINLNAGPSAQNNKIWNNTIHDRIYTPSTGRSNSFCVNGIDNSYIGNATGPDCTGWYPYSGTTVEDKIIIKPGNFTLTIPMQFINVNVGIDCNNSTTLDGNNFGTGIRFTGSRAYVKNCTLQNFASGIEFSTYASDNNATGNTTQNNTNGINLNAGPSAQNNKIWNNTIHDRIYTPDTGRSNSFCVNGEDNNYLNNSTGPDCTGWYPYPGMIVEDKIVLKPGFFTITSPLRSVNPGIGIDCNNLTTLNGTGNGTGIEIGNTNSYVKNCTLQNFDNGILIKFPTWDNNVSFNEFKSNDVSGVYLENATTSNRVIQNKFYDKGIIDIGGTDIFCSNCVGNNYYQGATGPLCEASCHCENGVMDNGQLEQGIDCGGNCTNCQEQYGNCVPVIKNGFPNEKINVSFVGSGFPDLNTFAWVTDYIIDYDSDNNGLMFFEPFKSDKNKFNFWRLNVLEELDGTPTQGLGGKWNYSNLEKRSREIALSCQDFLPNEIITLMITPRIVSYAYKWPDSDIGLHEAYVTLGSEFLTDSGWIEVGSTLRQDVNYLDRNTGNISKQRVFGPRSGRTKAVAHEFGHSFGGLADEYDSSKLANRSEGDTPNCDDDNLCSKWSGFNGITCDQNCFYGDWYRPYDNSLMRNQWKDTNYLPVNEAELEKDIDRTINRTDLRNLGSNIWGFLITGIWSAGNFIFNESDIVESNVSNYGTQFGSHSLKIYGNTGDLLFDGNFSVPLFIDEEPLADWFDENGNQNFFDLNASIIDLNSVEYTIFIPYYNDANLVEVFDINGESIGTVNVSNLIPINYTLGYGGEDISNMDINISYSLLPQPTGKLIGIDYNVILGRDFNFK